ncbi:uncharacterized protein B0H18DRAFT_40834 [Fomitopsis serialis]|uniref:uncharacterized protein n=1 Tax=Fomitopsis serialis TaxID=139415 RepID=UPI002007C407|nr:uncharacterized protein B0H18DRAFT_40834 [Neoantrodia serialis]KAH9917261.1 hypothetical protein B0H18DRAFT_40834 [Neoantrodia serialis]
MVPRRNNRARTPKLCRNYTLGYCPQGERCKYLHVVLPASSTPQATYPPTQPEATQLLSTQTSTAPPLQWFQMGRPIHALNATARPWASPPTFQVNRDISVPPPSAPQYRSLSWRTSLCRHFSRHHGWCPLGDECNYIHDLELAAIALEDVRFPDGRPPPEGNHGEGPPQAGSKHSHCWAYIQGLCHVEACPYLHPVQAHLFIRHTPCLQWPNCTKGALCRYKHPEPIIPKVRTLPASIESPARAQPPSPVETTLGGAVQYQGTTYFPLRPQLPASPPAPSVPVPSLHIYEPQRSNEPMVRMGYGQYLGSPPWQHQVSPAALSSPLQYSTSYSSMSSLEAPGFALDVPRMPAPMHPSYAPHPRTPPFRDRLIYAANPLLGHPTPTPAEPMHRRDPSIPRTTVPVPQSIMEDLHKLSVAEEGEEQFPYVPPKTQRAGHARRVSVALRSKEDTDALGLFSGAPARQPWQTHGGRSAHKSWAPPSSSSTMTFL